MRFLSVSNAEGTASISCSQSWVGDVLPRYSVHIDSWWKEEAEAGIPSLWGDWRAHFPPLGGWIVEQLGLPLCCKALGCSVSVSLSPSSACLGAERSCCLIIPDVGKGLGADGTQHRKQESYGQNETAVLVLAWSLDFKSSVPREMKQWKCPFSYLWRKCLLSVLWAIALQRPVHPQNSNLPSAAGKLWLVWALPLLQYL